MGRDCMRFYAVNMDRDCMRVEPVNGFLCLKVQKSIVAK